MRVLPLRAATASRPGPVAAFEIPAVGEHEPDEDDTDAGSGRGRDEKRHRAGPGLAGDETGREPHQHDEPQLELDREALALLVGDAVDHRAHPPSRIQRSLAVLTCIPTNCQSSRRTSVPLHRVSNS
jgi:hypothetical protein